MSDPGRPAPAQPPEPAKRESARRFRKTLALVMAVQAGTLVLLWLLQQRYSA